MLNQSVRSEPVADPEFTQILYDVERSGRDDHVAPSDKFERVHGTMIREMIAAFDRVDADDGVRAVIVTGSDVPTAPAPTVGRGRDVRRRRIRRLGTSVGVPRTGAV